MPSPKSGKAETPVAPVKPAEALEADVADPGAVAKLKVEQREAKKGKYGQALVKPHKPPTTEEEKAEKKSWIEIELVDEKGLPVPGEPYLVTLPDGTTVEKGSLDEKGFVRIENIEPGTCKISFPNLDKDAWAPASGSGKGGAAGGKSGGQKSGDDELVGGKAGKSGSKKATPDTPPTRPPDEKGSGGKGSGAKSGGGTRSPFGGTRSPFGGKGSGGKKGGTRAPFGPSSGGGSKDAGGSESKTSGGKTGAAEDDLRGKVPGYVEEEGGEKDAYGGQTKSF